MCKGLVCMGVFVLVCGWVGMCKGLVCMGEFVLLCVRVGG